MSDEIGLTPLCPMKPGKEEKEERETNGKVISPHYLCNTEAGRS